MYFKIYKLPILLLLLFTFPHIFAQNERKVIKIGYFIAPPFTFESSDHISRGAIIDFYKNHIMPNTPYEFQFEAFPLTRLYIDLKKGDIDMIAMSSKNKTDFGVIIGENALYSSKSFLITKKNFKYEKITSASQLKDVVIGSNKDGARNSFLIQNKNVLNFEESSSQDSVHFLLKKLLAGRVDAVYGYLYYAFIYLAKKENVYDKIKIVEIPGDPVFVYAGYSPKLDPKIREKIEKQISIQINEKNINLDQMVKNIK
jgi:ABC-type amino acid transport substrate-binding protein